MWSWLLLSTAGSLSLSTNGLQLQHHGRGTRTAHVHGVSQSRCPDSLKSWSGTYPLHQLLTLELLDHGGVWDHSWRGQGDGGHAGVWGRSCLPTCKDISVF